MTESADSSQHRAIFTDARARYIYNFHMNAPADLEMVASRLLASNLARLVGFPNSDEIRTAPSYRELAQLREWSKVHHRFLTEHSTSAVVAWSSRNLQPAGKLFAGMAKAWLLDLLPTRGSASDASDTTETPELDWRDEAAATFQDIIFGIEKQVAGEQLELVIPQHVDGKMFEPEYLASVPFFRLALTPTLHSWKPSADAEPSEPDFRMDASLLIHTSGVCQLVLSFPLPPEVTADQLARLRRGQLEGFGYSELPESLIHHAGRDGDPLPQVTWTPDDQDTSGRWAATTDRLTAAEVFRLYLRAFGEIVSVPTGAQWLSYPVIFLGASDCCADQHTWLKNHRTELTGILASLPRIENFRPEQIRGLPEDTSIRKNISEFVSSNGMITIHWTPELEPLDYAGPTCLSQFALLQYWQLRSLAARLATARPTRSDVQRVQAEIIYGLQEYRTYRLTFGGADDDVDRILADHNLANLYQRILDGADQLQQIVANAEARAAAKRANILAGSAVFVAIILGLPGIEQSLNVLSQVQPHSYLMPTALHAFAADTEKSAWILYSILLMALAAIRCALALRRRWRRIVANWRDKHGHPKLPGDTWPVATVQLKVTERRTTGTDVQIRGGS